MNKYTLHIAITFDENYISPVYALLASIYNNANNERILIYAIVSGVCESQLQELRVFVNKYNSSITFYQVKDDFASSFIIPKTLWWTASIYYRLLLPALLPVDVERFLYLDTDIIILQSLSELFTTDMAGYPVAAVADKVSFRPELGITEPGTYFNSGVLLIDKKAWITQYITEKSIAFITEHSDKLINPDQDALNVALSNNWLKLNKNFNFMFHDLQAGMRYIEAARLMREVVVLHFTTQHKPWAMIGRNPFRYFYHRYVRMAPVGYRARYHDFVWNRHRIREMLDIRINELRLGYPLIAGQ